MDEKVQAAIQILFDYAEQRYVKHVLPRKVSQALGITEEELRSKIIFLPESE